MRILSGSILVALLYVGSVAGLLGLATAGPAPADRIADVDRPAAVAAAHTARQAG